MTHEQLVAIKQEFSDLNYSHALGVACAAYVESNKLYEYGEATGFVVCEGGKVAFTFACEPFVGVGTLPVSDISINDGVVLGGDRIIPLEAL